MIAYTTYAFFEWALILLDVGFDAVTALDFEAFELVIRDVQQSSRGYVHWLPKYANVGRCQCSLVEDWLRLLNDSNDRRIADVIVEKEYVLLDQDIKTFADNVLGKISL